MCLSRESLKRLMSAAAGLTSVILLQSIKHQATQLVNFYCTQVCSLLFPLLTYIICSRSRFESYTGRVKNSRAKGKAYLFCTLSLIPRRRDLYTTSHINFICFNKKADVSAHLFQSKDDCRIKIQSMRYACNEKEIMRKAFHQSTLLFPFVAKTNFNYLLNHKKTQTMQIFETKTIWIVKFRYDLVLPRFEPESKSRIFW
jgi:hypothetical protein